MIYDNPIEFFVYYLSFVSLLIIYFSSKILKKNKVLLGFKKESGDVGHTSFKKKLFLITMVVTVFTAPMEEIKKINILKSGNILCAIGEIDQSEENLKDKRYFEEFNLKTIDGQNKFFYGNLIKPDKALVMGRQTYVLFSKGELFKVAYMEENIELSQLQETQERLINEYMETIKLSYFDKENINEIDIEFYIISIILMILAGIKITKLVLFMVRYHSLIRRVKKYDSEERGRIEHERNYNDRVY